MSRDTKIQSLLLSTGFPAGYAVSGVPLTVFGYFATNPRLTRPRP
jgi:hypothetical protein